MGWDVSADTVDFEEAIAFFRAKVPMTKKDFDALDEEAQSHAFTVAGTTQLDMVYDVYDAIDEAIANGTGLEDFQEVMRNAIGTPWEAEAGGWRLETIFRTNVQQAYAAGRYAQQSDPETLADRPYWMYDLIDDGRQCDICDPCDGVCLPADHPWWRAHRPLLHVNCRCDVQSLTEEQAKGKVHDKGPDVAAAAGFGRPPELDAWQPRAADYPPELWAVWKEHRKERDAA